MKPRIFIGSSSEGLASAKNVKELLTKQYDYDCVLWNDGEIFGLNVSYLDSLLKVGSMFDFGILVATKDDKLETRGKKKESPRDNVIFEYGLFMGRLGKFRTLLMLEEGAKVPSDFEGIHISKFKPSKSNKPSASLKKQVEVIHKHIDQRYKLPELGLLASTSIAMGFYSNFIERVCNYLRPLKSEIIDGIEYNDFEVQVVIPAKIQHDMKNSATNYFKENGFTPHTFKPQRNRIIGTSIAPDKNHPNRLLICDIPTTLTALYDSIEMYLPYAFASESKEFELIEAREMNNFVAVLKSKIRRDAFSKKVVKFIEYSF